MPIKKRLRPATMAKAKRVSVINARAGKLGKVVWSPKTQTFVKRQEGMGIAPGVRTTKEWRADGTRDRIVQKKGGFLTKEREVSTEFDGRGKKIILKTIRDSQGNVILRKPYKKK